MAPHHRDCILQIAVAEALTLVQPLALGLGESGRVVDKPTALLKKNLARRVAVALRDRRWGVDLCLTGGAVGRHFLRHLERAGRSGRRVSALV